jgi:hypothetical protein
MTTRHHIKTTILLVTKHIINRLKSNKQTNSMITRIKPNARSALMSPVIVDVTQISLQNDEQPRYSGTSYKCTAVLFLVYCHRKRSSSQPGKHAAPHARHSSVCLIIPPPLVSPFLSQCRFCHRQPSSFVVSILPYKNMKRVAYEMLIILSKSSRVKLIIHPRNFSIELSVYGLSDEILFLMQGTVMGFS